MDPFMFLIYKMLKGLSIMTPYISLVVPTGVESLLPTCELVKKPYSAIFELF